MKKRFPKNAWILGYRAALKAEARDLRTGIPAALYVAHETFAMGAIDDQAFTDGWRSACKCERAGEMPL